MTVRWKRRRKRCGCEPTVFRHCYSWGVTYNHQNQRARVREVLVRLENLMQGRQKSLQKIHNYMIKLINIL